MPRMIQIKAAMRIKVWPDLAIHRGDLAGKLQRHLATQAGRFQSQCARIYSILLKMNALERPIQYPKMKTYQASCLLAAAVFMALPLRITLLILNKLPFSGDSKDFDGLSQIKVKDATTSSK
ncbi:hypothetical protein FRC07_008044, partial [Ceratobasidium sp. 392]